MSHDPANTTDDAPALERNAFFDALENADDAPAPVDDGSGLLDANEPTWDDAADPARESRRRRRGRQIDARGAALAWTLPGWCAAAAGITLAILTATAPASIASWTSALAKAGIAPIHLLITGLLLIAFGTQRRQTARLLAEQDRLADDIESRVGRLTEGSGGVESQEIDRILMALQRQDEKVNNLTRATKMYGKPLIEIANQVNTLSAGLDSVDRLAARLDDIEGKFAAASEKIETTVLSALEMNEDLPFGDQLADVLTTARRSADVLDNLRDELTDQLGQRWEETRRHIADSIDRMLDGNRASGAQSAVGSDVETCLSALQREVAGIATSIARLQRMPVATDGGGDTTPARAAEPPVASRSAPPPGAARTTDDPARAGDGPAHSIAGERQTSGKNVLGAIAKLKSMRN